MYRFLICLVRFKKRKKEKNQINVSLCPFDTHREIWSNKQQMKKNNMKRMNSTSSCSFYSDLMTVNCIGPVTHDNFVVTKKSLFYSMMMMAICLRIYFYHKWLDFRSVCAPLASDKFINGSLLMLFRHWKKRRDGQDYLFFVA